jgi:hypothetical protein
MIMIQMEQKGMNNLIIYYLEFTSFIMISYYLKSYLYLTEYIQFIIVILF